MDISMDGIVIRMTTTIDALYVDFHQGTRHRTARTPKCKYLLKLVFPNHTVSAHIGSSMSITIALLAEFDCVREVISEINFKRQS